MPPPNGLVRPPALRQGDTVAVVSPSCPGASFLTEELNRGCAALRRMGFEVRLMPNARGARRWTSGTVADRLADLHAAFAAPDVAAVLYSMGGQHSAQLLGGLDYDLVTANPKVFCGYSDATSLLTAVHVRTGLVTFYGPALIPQFGELPEPYRETADHFLATTAVAAPAGPLPRIGYQVVDLDYGRREREQRPRDREPAPPRTVLRGGAATGQALALCLPSVRDLLGTPWQPDTAGRVLFVEAPEPPYTAAAADADLWHLGNAGLLDRVAAVVLGRPIGWTDDEVAGFLEAVLECVPASGVPVVGNVEFGHTNPILTIPNGVEVAVSGADVTILEAAVR
ncbi:LD-carboxypeptidase [Actinophytocola sp. NPDC049390]|uniref:LD-carboxypeptidase n=1 Tax=Actinophytocola sp. NPDC049390 TaxID=3363894 RepID=UPI00379C8086